MSSPPHPPTPPAPSPRACTASTAHCQLWAGQESCCCCCLTDAQIQQNAPAPLCSSQQSGPQAQTTLSSCALPMKHFLGLVFGFLAVVLVCEAGGQNTPGPFHFTPVSSPREEVWERAAPFPESPFQGEPPLTALLISFPSLPVEKLLPHQHIPELSTSLWRNKDSLHQRQHFVTISVVQNC